jgi:hypothetical protein
MVEGLGGLAQIVHDLGFIHGMTFGTSNPAVRALATKTSTFLEMRFYRLALSMASHLGPGVISAMQSRRRLDSLRSEPLVGTATRPHTTPALPLLLHRLGLIDKLEWMGMLII